MSYRNLIKEVVLKAARSENGIDEKFTQDFKGKNSWKILTEMGRICEIGT
jgi:hypothetical protein